MKERIMTALPKIKELPQSTPAASTPYKIVSAPPRSHTVPRICFVTGGTGGIGSSICKKLASMGQVVATTYRNEEKARAWEVEMKKEGYTFHLYKCDVSNFEEVQKTVKAIIADLGPIQVLVNNAGITRDSTLRKMSVEQWRDVMSCNLDSVFNVTHTVLDGMLQSGFGRIINISSINGQKGQFGQANYAAAKAGMHGFTKALAQEVAKKGITVNTVSPGYIDTDMIKDVPENIRQSIMTQIPVGRFGKPEEIAFGVAFLVSDMSRYVTGQVLNISGGLYI